MIRSDGSGTGCAVVRTRFSNRHARVSHGKSVHIVFESIQKVTRTLQERSFLFQQLVKRDFEKRYKGTILGMAWSILSPLLQLLVMMLVFSQLFGRNVEHYVIYLFSGNILMSYFREGTRNGMRSLTSNANIITKINVPKYLFLLSSEVQALVNFGLTVIVFFFFCILDKVDFTPTMLMLWYPALCLTVMNIGIGMILSALFVFFRDTSYFYDIFLTLLNYLSAIFYTIDRFPASAQRYFLLNPVYVMIKYWREAVISASLPSPQYHFLMAFYALFFLGIGAFMYKRYNHQFLYYF